MKKLFGLSIILAAVLVLFPGCNGKEKSEDNSKVLAMVNGEKITQADFDAELAGKPDNFRRMVENPEGKKMMLNRLIERKLIMQTAEKEGVSNSPDIQKRVDAFKERVIMEEMRKKLTVAQPANDQDLQAYYDQHKDQYNMPEMAHLRKISVSDKSKADQIAKQLKAAPTKFEELARENSEDQMSKMRGGDVGFVLRAPMISPEHGGHPLPAMTGNTLPPELADRVFPLKKDQVSQVFEIEGKYVIFQMIDLRPAQTKTLDDVKDQIKRTMEFEKTQEKWKEYIDGLKKQAKIEIVGGEQAPQTPAQPHNAPAPVQQTTPMPQPAGTAN
jgi:peptidyl-prolyl cis-trans isomerase C